MKSLINILKKDFAVSYGAILNPKAALKDKKTRNRFLASIFGYGVLIFYAVLFAIMISSSLESVYKLSGKFVVNLSYGISIFMITLLFSLAMIISSIYYSKDLEIMLRLPIREEDMYLSKLIVSQSFGVLVSLAVTIPIGIFYIRQGLSSFYLVNVIISGFLIVISTVSVLQLVIVWIMKYINRFKSVKNILQILGFVLIMVFSFSAQFIFKQKFASIFMERIGDLSSNIFLKTLFANIFLFSKGLDSNLGIGQNVLYFLGQIILTVFLVFISVKLGSRPMVQGAISGSEGIGKKEAKNLPGQIFLI